MANENLSESPALPDTAPYIEEIECVVSDPHWGKIIKLSNNGNSTKDVHVLTEETYRAGRAPSCELMISETDMDTKKYICISKVHFRIERKVVEDKQLVYLEDLSSNGTYVNEKKVGKNSKIIIQNAAEISLASPHLKMFVFYDNSISSHDKWLHCSMTNRFYILESLGTGTFGDVRLVIDQKTYQRYAMKKIMRGKMSDDKIFNEVNILKRLQHPCITHLEDIYETPEAVYITLEYVSGGNLFSRIVKSNKISEKETKAIFYQLLMGVDYLHKEGITHRDLKPENILLQSTQDCEYMLVKITDFGLSKIQTEGTQLKTICGTMRYMAPEVLMATFTPQITTKTSYDNKVDIWSLGVILYVCLSGQHPFTKDDNTSELVQQIMNGRYKFPQSAWKNISIEAIHTIRKILVIDPCKRISIADLRKHKWLQDREMVDNLNFLITEKSVEDLEPVLKKQKMS